ncbi:TrmB family transcriptional regulator [Candidatus Pacearchaeota archaeon]|nr:TrmB family transcriptional regulator [Candidatus Pacearchaeota archaeon]
MLKEFGLTDTEEKIYLALLSIGSSSASEIIKKTQLHRTTVYDVLERLIGKGFASYVIQNKIKCYSAVSPSKFVDIALEEKQQAEKKQKLAKEVFKKIKSIKEEAQTKFIAQIFVGIKGQKTVMNNMIEENRDFILFGAEGKFSEDLPAYTEQWANWRTKKNIRAKIIITEGSRAPIWKMNRVKFISKEYQSPASTFVYGNKVAIFIHENPVIIILIESKKLAKSYRNYFKILWKVAKKS